MSNIERSFSRWPDRPTFLEQMERSLGLMCDDRKLVPKLLDIINTASIVEDPTQADVEYFNQRIKNVMGTYPVLINIDRGAYTTFPNGLRLHWVGFNSLVFVLA